MADIQVVEIEPDDLGDVHLTDFDRLFLAQGDSWFSIGDIPPWSTANILQKLKLGLRTCAVNCAHPGEVLAHMVEWRSNAKFVRQLSGRFATRWNAILLSGGGNDLIDAVGAPPVDRQRQPVVPALRLLLTQKEWKDGPDVSRYLSDPGWTTFRTHLAAQFDALIALRDQDVNNGTPLFFHTYDYPTPRNAAAGPLGPWLFPALTSYGIPQTDWIDLAHELINRLAKLLQDIVGERPDKQLHLIDTRGLLSPARLNSTRKSGDWENEIHPTDRGYTALAARWRSEIEKVV